MKQIYNIVKGLINWFNLQMHEMSYNLSSDYIEMCRFKRKGELSTFMKKYSLRIKKVVDSCTNEAQLQNAEAYIRNGLNAEVRLDNNIMANEYISLFITPKRLELEDIYNSN